MYTAELDRPTRETNSTPTAATVLMAGTFANSSHAANFIIFGEIGVGRSSLINLIAGEKLATTSSGATSCTLQSTKYKVKLHDCQCEVNLYDTVSKR